MDRDRQIELLVGAEVRSKALMASWDRDPDVQALRRRQADEARRQRALDEVSPPPAETLEQRKRIGR